MSLALMWISRKTNREPGKQTCNLMETSKTVSRQREMERITLRYGTPVTKGNMKCPKKHVKDDFVVWWHLHIYLKYPKIEEFYFRFLFCLKNWSRANNMKCPTFLCPKYLKCPICPIWFWNISDLEKWGISNYLHVTKFLNSNGTDNETLRFWAISNKCANAIISYGKIIFQMLFGIFHITSRICYIMYEP